MRESAFQQKVLKFLKDKKIYAIKFNASGLTKVGVPDILMCLRGRFVGIEVKTDTAAAHTGNLVIELITNKALNKDGWFKVSTADKFAFYLEETNEVIFIDANELKENYKQALNRIYTTTQYECGYIYKEGVIGLLSITQLSNLSSFRRIAI